MNCRAPLPIALAVFAVPLLSSCFVNAGNASESPVLTRSEEEPRGDNCPAGGKVLKTGNDTNRNGDLDEEEVTSRTYLCSDHHPVLVRDDEEPHGSNCPHGGTAQKSGPDSDADGVLDEAEVTSTRYTCYDNPSGWAAYGFPWRVRSVIPPGYWAPTGHTVTIGTHAARRLKVTYSDNLGAGTHVEFGGGISAQVGSAVDVRMRPDVVGDFSCTLVKSHKAPSGRADIFAPFSTVCVTPVLAPGVYTFDVWVYGWTGNTSIGFWQDQSLLMVEELPTEGVPSRDSYSLGVGPGTLFWQDHDRFETADAGYQPVPGRTVTYQKQHGPETWLKVTLADTLAVGVGADAGSAFVAVAMNGEPPEDAGCAFQQWDDRSTPSELHDPFVSTCLYPNLQSGAYAFGVWLRSQAGPGNAEGKAVMGSNRSYPLLLVEELPAAGRSFARAETASDFLQSAEWQPVKTPAGEYLSVQHTAGANVEFVRITYSDTLLGAICNGYVTKLGVRGGPNGDVWTPCTTGLASYSNPAPVNRGHRRPINLTCVLPVSPESRTQKYSLWAMSVLAGTEPVDTSCNSRLGVFGQRLLLVEDLPR